MICPVRYYFQCLEERVRNTITGEIISESYENEDQSWTRFIEAQSGETFCVSWLNLLCRMLDDAQAALLLLGEPDVGPFTPAAVWPDPHHNVQHLVAPAQQSLTKRRGFLIRPTDPDAGDLLPPDSVAVAYPVELDKRLYGVVVVQLTTRSDNDLQVIQRQIHWGSAWLETLFQQHEMEHQKVKLQCLATVMDLTASAFFPGDFQKVAIAITNQIAARLECNRVSLGILRKDFVELQAISHTAKFNIKTNLTRDLEAAMDEAVDQQETIALPSLQSKRVLVTRSHEKLVREHDIGHVLTVPLQGREQPFGALLLERLEGQPFDDNTLIVAESLSVYLGPILEAQWVNERSLGWRLLDVGRKPLAKLLGPGYFAWKLAGIIAILTALFLAFAEGNFRISAKTVVEGEVQRALVAPFDGYLAQAPVRAGDAVRQGQILAEMDDRDLKLEQIKLTSEQEQIERKFREALGKGDRAAVRIITAQLAQMNAELELINDKLARTRIAAPFDGSIVSGDLSQKLGSPMVQGSVMFEVAPLDAYRLILQVDERDISFVSIGQKGLLRLSGLPHDTMRFKVTKLTPVSTPAEGHNYFKVEAQLEERLTHLGPGMEGAGKIEVGRNKLIWIWTRGLVDWIRLWLWKWSF
jgi:GAF domain-containing protein